MLVRSLRQLFEHVRPRTRFLPFWCVCVGQELAFLMTMVACFMHVANFLLSAMFYTAHAICPLLTLLSN